MAGDSLRLFAAVFPDRAALDSLTALQTEMPEGVRPTARDRIHLTLRFFGDTPPDEASALIRQAVGNAFEVRLVSAGGFPSARSRIYAARAEPTEGLCGLMRRLGDDDPKPHITIGRRREPTAMKSATIRPIKFRPPRVLLINSVMGPRPCYETIEEWALS